jgi:hypoxanthine phosphoribosyltransferase
MGKYVSRVLVSRDEIDTFCRRLGEEITRDYQGKELLVICVLKGAFVFLADLIMAIEVPCEVDFMAVSSYEGIKSSGVVRIIKDLDQNIAGKHVLLVEDIVDTGLTLEYLVDILSRREPASIRICTAFDKPNRRKGEVNADYIGRVIPDEFIVGYGLDYNGFYRNLPDVSVLEDLPEESDE